MVTSYRRLVSIERAGLFIVKSHISETYIPICLYKHNSAEHIIILHIFFVASMSLVNANEVKKEFFHEKKLIQ